MIQLIKIYRPPGQMNEMGLINQPIPYDFIYDSTPSAFVPSATTHSSSKSMENGQIVPLKFSSTLSQRPILSPD